MINNPNRAATIAQISRMIIPQATAPIDYGIADAVQNGINMYYKVKDRNEAERKQDAFEAAVQSGDANAIKNSYAVLDPLSYAKGQIDFENQKYLLGEQAMQDQILQELRNQGRNQTTATKNYEYLLSQGVPKEEAKALAFIGDTEAVGNALVSGTLGRKGLNAYDTAMGKAKAERESARQDFESLLPSARDAISRAEKAIDEGTGLGAVIGRLGELGISSEKGAKNQADINAANSQMNAVLRQKLASTGLTGSELNSALEAQAYRYTIDPTRNPEYNRQQIKNFVNDYLNTKTSVDLKAKYGLE